MRSLARISLVFAMALLLGGAGKAAAQGLDAQADPRLFRELAVEVRAAPLSEVLAGLEKAFGVRLAADPALAGQRVTIQAKKESLYGLLQAISALLHAPWVRTGEGDERQYALVRDPAFEQQVAALRLQRRAAFVSRLLQTEAALRQTEAESVAAELRENVRQRMPYLPVSSLDELSADYIRQVLLVDPIRFGLQPQLLRTGFAWAPFSRLPPDDQQLLTAFVLDRYLRTRPPIGGVAEAAVTPIADGAERLTPNVLSYPQARVEYRVLFGDRWTGTLLMTRVGAGDTWATAYLPSTLYALPDYATLYPEAGRRVQYAELGHKLDLTLNPGEQSFEQALAAVARAAGIDLVADSYLRPPVFAPNRAPVLKPATLGEALDQVAEWYGYAWWKYGDTYVFRNRLWAEQQRVALPDYLLQLLARGFADRDRLSPEQVAALATLTDEQLLTLDLTGRTPAAPDAPAPERLNYEAVQLARAGLLLFAQMSPQQRAMAMDRGIPVQLMSPAQQYLFAALGYDRNLYLNPYASDVLGFRIESRVRPERSGGITRAVGDLSFVFDFGEGEVRRSRISMNVPLPALPEPADTTQE